MKYAILSVAIAFAIAGSFIGGVVFGRKIEQEAVLSQPVDYRALSTLGPSAPYSDYSYTPDYDSGSVYTPSK